MTAFLHSSFMSEFEYPSQKSANLSKLKSASSGIPFNTYLEE
jgi:hypothetical protein